MKKAVAVTFAALTMGLGGTASALAADLARYEPAPQEQDDRNGVKIGYLTCDIGGGVGYVLGSAKELDCTFQSTMGARRTDHYTGAIRKMGVDLGFTTQGRLVWAVFAPTAGYHRGSLGGLYQGATAEVTVGLGVGTNVLVGGTSGSIQLQTVSVTGQVGLNLAATGTSVTLTATN
ncbi:DUF992 domain-containing protein [Agrobacterium radiobacter]|uniref:DUF992 domain-containing protein n=1 Tax=Agrobacterium TaxID=357 RepID=UPI000D1DF9C4|nr:MULTISPECIES: DUF992 domain-containing protein [Agrobacterium]UNZ53135.1 DUF992 domain-containing protein [Agrobacterium tumefaciens]